MVEEGNKKVEELSMPELYEEIAECDRIVVEAQIRKRVIRAEIHRRKSQPIVKVVVQKEKKKLLSQ